MAKIYESGEDYLEAIYMLEDERGQVRSVDVANRLKVTRPSVNKAVAALKEAGMVEQQLYGNIFLTEKGRALAKEVQNKHDVLRTFLCKVIGISMEVAEEEACRIEHIISDKTFEGFTMLLTEWGDKDRAPLILE